MFSEVLCLICNGFFYSFLNSLTWKTFFFFPKSLDLPSYIKPAGRFFQLSCLGSKQNPHFVHFAFVHCKIFQGIDHIIFYKTVLSFCPF